MSPINPQKELNKMNQLFSYDLERAPDSHPRANIPEDSSQIAQDLRTCGQLDYSAKNH